MPYIDTFWTHAIKGQQHINCYSYAVPYVLDSPAHLIMHSIKSNDDLKNQMKALGQM